MPPPQDHLLLDGTANQSENEGKSISDCVTGIYSHPHHKDGTPFPENFLDHESVMGYASDRPPSNDGADDILEVVSLFEREGLRCCIIEVMALQYYGSERMENDWWICLSDTLISQAEALVRARSDRYIPFAPDVRLEPDDPRCRWARFKCVGLGLFFLLVPAREVCLVIEKEDSIVRGKTGLPFPSLPVFVQSLIDSKYLLDLEEVVDGMNLSEEWAATNGVHISDKTYPDCQVSPRTHWERITCTRQTRMGRKYNPRIYATRYRRHNERDPRKTGWL